jgi:hypothetical protein
MKTEKLQAQKMLQVVTTAVIVDSNIRSIVRDLATYGSGEMADFIVYFGEDTDSCDIEVYIDIYETLEDIMSEAQDSNENGIEFEAFDDTEMGTISLLMEILRETERHQLTSFIVK